MRKPIISRNPEDVSYLNASVSGLFVPTVRHGARLDKNALIERIVDPLRGTVLDEVRVPDLKSR